MNLQILNTMRRILVCRSAASHTASMLLTTKNLCAPNIRCHSNTQEIVLLYACRIAFEAWRANLLLDLDRYAKRVGKPLNGIVRDSMHRLSEALLLDCFRERSRRQRSANGLDYGITLEAPLRPIHRGSPKGADDARKGVYMDRLDLQRNEPTAHDDN
jgi:hypothetical protein